MTIPHQAFNAKPLASMASGAIPVFSRPALKIKDL
jgi:hypothetical protein